MKDTQRLYGTSRDISPCKDCTERFTACHDHCPKDERGEFGHHAWLKRRYEIEKERKAYLKERNLRWQKTNF